MKRKVLFAGSFDPFTNGHLDIARRALDLFDELIIGVGDNPNKKYVVGTEERCSSIKACFSETEPVSVLSFDGLTIDFVLRIILIIIRGIRDSKDLSFEQPIALANRDMKPDIDTVFLLADPKLQFYFLFPLQGNFINTEGIFPSLSQTSIFFILFSILQESEKIK